MNRFRPESNNVPFWIEAPNVTVKLTLPKWNTHYMHANSRQGDIGVLGLLRLDGSYQYFTGIRDGDIDQLKLGFNVSVPQISSRSH
jgi:hypothetical protein